MINIIDSKILRIQLSYATVQKLLIVLLRLVHSETAFHRPKQKKVGFHLSHPHAKIRSEEKEVKNARLSRRHQVHFLLERSNGNMLYQEFTLGIIRGDKYQRNVLSLYDCARSK